MNKLYMYTQELTSCLKTYHGAQDHELVGHLWTVWWGRSKAFDPTLQFCMITCIVTHINNDQGSFVVIYKSNYSA